MTRNSPHSSAVRALARLVFFIAVSGMLAAPLVQAAQFTLRWSDNSTNETGFKIERATGTTGAFAEIATMQANTTSFVDTNLPPATTYRYRVRAYNSAGNSGYSNTATGTTPAGGNTAPTVSAIAAQSVAEDGVTTAIAFTVADAETAATSLAVSAVSSQSSLVPSGGIVLGGSGANRTITIRPAANQSGTTTITVRASDGTLVGSRSFSVTVTAVNDTPTISTIASRTVSGGTSSGTIAFNVADVETAAGSLTVSASSSNTALIPASALVLGGTGSARTLSFTPAPTTTGGSATITVRVSDGALSASSSFVVAVPASATSTNTAPTITSISNQNIVVNSTTAALPFTIGDTQTATSALTIVTNSSDQTLVPRGNIALGGSGANRTITVRPVTNTTGWSTIWVQVSDGSMSKTISFVVNVSVGLTFGDIGGPTLAGSGTQSGGKVTLKAAGTDIWGGSDQFHFGRQGLIGDSEVTVRVASLTNTHAWAKAGLMYRASTAANSAYVFVCLTPSNGVALQYRTGAGSAAQQKYTEAATLPRWLKLTRTGDTFYAFHSADGATWDLVDSVTVDLPDTALAGVAATSHAAGTLTTATFDGLSVD